MIIHLELGLLPTSSDQPEGLGRATRYTLLFGLAPNGVCQAIPITRDTGGLLPRLFTLTPPVAGRYVFCGTFLLVTKTGRYPASCPMELGLSSRRKGRAILSSTSTFKGFLSCPGSFESRGLFRTTRRPSCARGWRR
jgi:hypothetical protein